MVVSPYLTEWRFMSRKLSIVDGFIEENEWRPCRPKKNMKDKWGSKDEGNTWKGGRLKK